jgi:hypothetical protein
LARGRRPLSEPVARAATPKEAKKILDAVEETEPLASIDEESDLRLEERRSLLKMKERYAKALLWGLAFQIIIVDAFFFNYAQWGVHWRVSASVMDVWLGATVVEVISILLVIANHLFPTRSRLKSEEL